MFHVRQTLFHDAEHLEIGGPDLLGKALTARIVFGAFAFAFEVQLLLLVEATDDFLETGFHFAGYGAGLAQVFDHGGREEPNGWRVGACRLRDQKRDDQPGKNSLQALAEQFARIAGQAAGVWWCNVHVPVSLVGVVSRDSFLCLGVERFLPELPYTLRGIR